MSSQVNMRGPWLKTPLLFLLLLMSSLTGTAFCQEDETEGTLAPEPTKTVETATAEFYSAPTENTLEPDLGSASGDSSDVLNTTYPENGGGGEPDYTTYILIAVVAVVVIAGAIICGIVIVHRRRQKGGNQELSKVDPVLDGSSTEKVPMPMFEEDVPSVLELEMDELDQWMKKDIRRALRDKMSSKTSASPTFSSDEVKGSSQP